MKGLDLAEYFITSKASINKKDKDTDTKIIVKKSLGTKCPRCWKIIEDKCVRCENVIKEKLN